MSRNMVNVVFDNDKVMQQQAYILSRLGRSFEDVGNDKVATILYDVADVLSHQGKAVIDAHGALQEAELRRSNESTANILTALVAGV